MFSLSQLVLRSLHFDRNESIGLLADRPEVRGVSNALLKLFVGW